MSRRIPSTWAPARLADLGVWRGGGTPSKAEQKYWTGGSIPWVSPKDMKVERLRDSEDHITEAAVAGSATNLVPPNSVLVVTRSGILAHTLPVAINDVEVTVNQDLKALVPHDGIDSAYVAYALRAEADQILGSCAKHGTTVHNIEFSRFLDYEIAVAPQAEQRRVVAAIETQVTRIDEAARGLAATQRNLKRYRASVLQAAVEGRLVPTEAELARAEHRTPERPREPAAAAAASSRRAGRLWGSGEIPPLSEEERTRLPSNWKWVKVRDLGPDPETVVQVGPMSMRSKDFASDGLAVLNVGCVGWGRFHEEKLDFMPHEKAKAFARYAIQPGDVLFTRSGTVGRCAVAEPHQDGWLMTFHLLRARTDPSLCLPEYLRAVFEGAAHVRRQTRQGSIGTTRAGFNTGLLASLDVPLPPLSEQVRIVQEISRQISILESLHHAVAAAIARVRLLRQAVLRHAFEGKLVDQDPVDEPASVLLERIRKEREEVAARAGARRGARGRSKS